MFFHRKFGIIQAPSRRDHPAYAGRRSWHAKNRSSAQTEFQMDQRHSRQLQSVSEDDRLPSSRAQRKPGQHLRLPGMADHADRRSLGQMQEQKLSWHSSHDAAILEDFVSRVGAATDFRIAVEGALKKNLPFTWKACRIHFSNISSRDVLLRK